MTRLIVAILTLLIISTTAFAGWKGPETIVSGGWGDSAEEFGLWIGESVDSFPVNFGVDRFGKVYINDSLNQRVKVYSNIGELLNIVEKKGNSGGMHNWPHSLHVLSSGSFAITYGKNIKFYDGEFNKVLETELSGPVTCVGDQYFIYADVDKYKVYSNDAAYLHDAKMPDGWIDVISRRKIGAFEYEFELNSFDNETSLKIVQNSKKIENKFYDGEFLFVVQRKTVDLDGKLIRTSDNSLFSVSRYSSFGRLIASIDLPINKYEVVGEDNTVGQIERVVVEYGSPIVSTDGSIYTWKRTPDTYSIIKWKWVD